MKNKIDLFETGGRLLNNLEMIALIGTGIATTKSAPAVKSVDGFVTVYSKGPEVFNELKKLETLEEGMKPKGMKSEKLGCKTSICKKCSGCKLHLENAKKV